VPELSKYLPPDFDSSKPIGLIAGRGLYPKLVADEARAKGAEIRLIAFEGEATDELIESFPNDQRAVVNVGKVGSWLKALRKFECVYTIAAGQVKPGKLFRGLKPDIKAASLLFKLKRKNADTIFGSIAEELAANGQTALDKIEATYIQHGIEIATEMARLDVGQGVVVRKGTVIAVEAFEGTDPMLKRAGSFETDQLIFAKTVKHRQDFRFDVPVFGLRTLETMMQAGIRAAILKAGSVIMLEKQALLEQAKSAKIQLYGF
jgi:DUF1009 family protein